MNPYYADDSVTIYHGDSSLVRLPDVDFAAVITDPPYGLNYRGQDWDGEIPTHWLEVARMAAPVVVFTTAPLTVWRYPEPDWMACWARPASNSRTKQGGFNHWTPILLYGDVKLPTDLISLHAIANRSDPWIDHPSPKPLKLMRWMVEHTTKPGDLILDPFMGSGTTLRAAKDLGRHAIGIEIEERYCEIAARRCSQEVLGLTA